MSHPPADSPHQTAPMVVDATVLAHGGLTWESEVSGVQFARLTEMALSDSPTVRVSLRFGLLAQHPIVSGAIKAELQLRCQRCLRAMSYPVDEQFQLMLLNVESDSAHVPDTHDVWLTNPAHLDVLELVEEQLLLALPLIAMHVEERDCVAQAVTPVAQAPKTNVSGATAQKPFGNLRELMRKP